MTSNHGSGYKSAASSLAMEGHSTTHFSEHFPSLVSGRAKGWRPALLRAGLWLASVPYGVGVHLRNAVYRHGWASTVRVPVPVVSVGNLTVGGTGKTPCVEYISRLYRRRNLRVAILSRGYGSNGGRNDEAMVLEENLPDVPHLQGADRAVLAEAAIRELNSEVVVLDDGFQHRRLERDLDLLLIDASNPWGYGNLLPRGLLREPVQSARRADLVILTRCDQVEQRDRQMLREEIRRLAPTVPVIESNHGPVEWRNSKGDVIPLSALRGKSVAAFCGIGNPEAFRRTLADLNVSVVAWRSFRDHHAYPHADVEELDSWVAKQTTAHAVVTTQKDLVKLRLTELGGRPLWAVRIGLQIEAGQDVLDGKLCSVMPAA